ncbi:hypothetical protein CH379_019775 [Leptospira ellisii]|uniref:Uncharacterized protein n=1 Tax=Leptospira ellisii TaxID=2023197 RepID=A0A2N0B355_9LEPT|nr:hypothetical protein [Leptospira ellisii]MDV6237871.1 hypothetical protein [Leptospira ellisii]PJZ90962.1 hypothetical protein CH379_21365 [Leptospira ellisii]
MPISVGDVFIWSKFEGHNDKTIKDAWFVYIGKTGIYSEIFIAYLLRTTTQKHHYEENGSRSSHVTFSFNPKNLGHSFFNTECLLDLTEKPFSIKDDIESLEKRGILIKKGTLSKSDLKDIYVKINKNKFISKIDKTNIRDSLRLIGITGLPD